MRRYGADCESQVLRALQSGVPELQRYARDMERNDMTASAEDKRVIRDLAKRVAEIASDPVNSRKRDMWMRLNRLERVRPLIHVQAIAWNIWEELIPGDQLETTD